MNTSAARPKSSRKIRWPHRAAILLTAFSPLGWPAPACVAETPATPPAFPDSIHVSRGCYVSTAAYVARFTAKYPAEFARTLTIAPCNFDGLHTIAVLTWRGRWWARDEYLGVFALDCAVTAKVDVPQLRDRAEARIVRLARRQLKAGRLAPPAG